MNHGYEVTWPSSYSPSPDCLDAGELDADAVGYSARDFEFKFQALAFARKIRLKAVVWRIAEVREFDEHPDPYVPGLRERDYIGETIILD